RSRRRRLSVTDESVSVKAPENRAVHCMREDDRDRRPDTVMKAKEAWRLQLARRLGPVLLARHARVDARQQRQGHDQHERSMDDSREGAAPPSCLVPGMKGCDIEE